MKILHLLGSGRPGGVESFVLQLVRDIPRSDAEISVCIIGDDGPMSDELRQAGATVALHGIPGLAAQVAREKPDIIHANSGGRSHRIAARVLGAPLINHLHGLEEAWMDPRGQLLPKMQERIAELEQGADEIAVSSEWMEKLILAHRRSKPVVRLDYGVDIHRFSPSVRDAVRPHERARLGLGGEDFVIGFVGRLVQQKGVDAVLNLAATFLEDRSVKVVAAGHGALAGWISSEVKSRGLANVVLAGPTLDAPATMSAFDVVVMPSKWEPFGIVAIEAAAMGIPVAAFDVGGIPETVIDNHTGILVPAGDETSLAAGIRRLLNDVPLRRELGANARERAVKAFSTEAQSARILEHYRELITSAGAYRIRR